MVFTGKIIFRAEEWIAICFPVDRDGRWRGATGLYSGGEEREYYRKEAVSLARLLIENQNEDGSWSWSMGDGAPDEAYKKDTGSCEKGTAAIAYLLLELYRLSGGEALRESASRALDWCGSHIKLDVEEGYGGIAASSINSGITGLPFLTVATGYGNAFYLLARQLLEVA